MAILSIQISIRDLLDCGVNPAGRRPGIGKHFCTQCFGQPSTNFRDDLRGNPFRTERFEGLNDQAAFPQLKPSLFQCGVFKSQGVLPIL